VRPNNGVVRTQDIEKARAASKYQGRPVDADLHKQVKELSEAGLGYARRPGIQIALLQSSESKR